MTDEQINEHIDQCMQLVKDYDTITDTHIDQCMQLVKDYDTITDTHIDRCMQLVKDYDTITDTHIDQCMEVVTDSTDIAQEYARQHVQVDMGFNVFEIISKNYHQEKYHDHILEYLFNYTYQGEKKLLRNFLDYLCKEYPAKVQGLSPYDFLNTKAYQEKDRIDVSIRDYSSKKAVIIENKIYNAADQPKQLPRYYKDLTEQGYEVVAVVYMPQNTSKKPNGDGWEQEDNNNINPLLCHLPIYNEQGKPSLYGWLLGCLHEVDDINAVATLKQYSKLIQKLGATIMDSRITNKFFQEIEKKKDGLETVLSIRDMANGLGPYLAQRMIDWLHTNNVKSSRIWVYTDTCQVCEIQEEMGGRRIAIDTFIQERQNEVTLFSSSEEELQKNKGLLEGIGMLHEFRGDWRYMKQFSNPNIITNQEETYKFIKLLAEKISAYLQENPEAKL